MYFRRDAWRQGKGKHKSKMYAVFRKSRKTKRILEEE